MSLGRIWTRQKIGVGKGAGPEVLKVNPNRKPAACPPKIMAIKITKKVCTSYFLSDRSLPPYQKASPEAGDG
jgi:hypothetical protein